MEEYVATFFSHYGAMAFKKKCDQEKYPARIMPVPRNLSSSCGTCVSFAGEAKKALGWKTEELEQLARRTPEGGYEIVWH